MKNRHRVRIVDQRIRPQIVFPLPPLVVPYGKTGTTRGRPQRTLQPIRFACPSTNAGWTLHSFRYGGEELLDAPCPADFLSAVSYGVHAPPIPMSPRHEWSVTAEAPPRPKPAHWSLWRKRLPGPKRRGLRLLKSQQRLARRRGLRMFAGAWPRWLPLPLPPAFQIICIGEIEPTAGKRASFG